MPTTPVSRRFRKLSMGVVSAAGLLSPEATAMQNAPPCAEARIVEPSARSTVAEARPTVRWEPIPGAASYRVEIESRIPEGRVLVAIDTVVSGATFRPPRPLTDHRGAVKLRISAGCPIDDGSTLREKGAWFLIDTSPLCPLSDDPTVSPDGRWLEWKAVPGALRYDVSLRETNGELRSEGQTKEPRYTLPAEGRPFVAIVRPYCPTGFGPRASLLVTP